MHLLEEYKYEKTVLSETGSIIEETQISQPGLLFMENIEI